MNCGGIPAKLIRQGLSYIHEVFGDGVVTPHVISGAQKRVLWSSPTVTGTETDMETKAIARLKKLGWEWFEYEHDLPDFPNPDRHGYFFII